MTRAYVEAMERAEQGLIDADLGGGLVEQRVPTRTRTIGGYGMIVGYRVKDRAVFLLGFARRENIEDNELLTLRSQAERWLVADAARLREGT